MAIRSVVTRGFGNGTFNGTIPLVTLRGYVSADEAADAVPRSRYRPQHAPVSAGYRPGHAAPATGYRPHNPD